jgi:hypothetical protein
MTSAGNASPNGNQTPIQQGDAELYKENKELTGRG